MKPFLKAVVIFAGLFAGAYVLVHQGFFLKRPEEKTSEAGPSRAQEVRQRAHAILEEMTLEEKLEYLSGVDAFYTKAIPRLGIPSFKMADGPVGVRNCGPTVSYPASICMAATWDKKLAFRLGTELGRDCRARGVHFLLGPGVNMCRSPLCGRTFEYLGEDPHLASKIAVAMIKGIQGQEVVATVKHLAGNNQEWDRHGVSSDIDIRTLREIYLPAFEAAIKKGHVGAIMTSYNLINGEHASQCKKINQYIIKDEFGFQGPIISDWFSTYDSLRAANGGLDLEMPWKRVMKKKRLLKAIQDHKLKESKVNGKVGRILRTAMEFSFFDRPQQDLSISRNNAAGRQVAYEIACNGIVLLKNQGLLPLERSKVQKLAVIGPRAHQAIPQGGGSSKVEPLSVTSLLNGISSAVNKDTQIFYASGVPDFSKEYGLDSFFSPTKEGLMERHKGLQAEYFDNPNLEGVPAQSHVDNRFSFAWKEHSYRHGGPVNDYSVRWTGFFAFPQEGDCTFYVEGHHKFRLFIDDNLVIDRWNTDGESLQWATMHLEEKRPYAIRVECSVGKMSQAFHFGVCAGPVNALQEAKEIAAGADAVILCLGFDDRLEGEDMDKPFRLPEAQNTLVHEVLASNQNVVAVITSGGNVDMSSWVDRVPSIVHAWFPGQEGGLALARILFGDVNPSGKLPISFERCLEDNPCYASYYDESGQKHVRYAEGVFMGYRGYGKGRPEPLFPFGHGLSYTTFQYSRLDVQTSKGHPPVRLSFTVKNTGRRAGAEAAQIYVHDGHSSVDRPEIELKGFEKVFLRSGEQKRVTLWLNERAFSYFDVEGDGWKLDPGIFTILVNSSASTNRLSREVSVAENRS
jgi:beta-glucosidase